MCESTQALLFHLCRRFHASPRCKKVCFQPTVAPEQNHYGVSCMLNRSTLPDKVEKEPEVSLKMHLVVKADKNRTIQNVDTCLLHIQLGGKMVFPKQTPCETMSISLFCRNFIACPSFQPRFARDFFKKSCNSAACFFFSIFVLRFFLIFFLTLG